MKPKSVWLYSLSHRPIQEALEPAVDSISEEALEPAVDSISEKVLGRSSAAAY